MLGHVAEHDNNYCVLMTSKVENGDSLAAVSI